ncbi:MAG: signal peptidase II [Clostridia bacterium]|nr:signal peptidase II [Clostridia bacterium]
MILYFVVTILVAGIDQTLKILVANNIKGKQDISLFNGILRFTYTENLGAAFGLLQGAKYMFILLVVLLLSFYLYAMLRKKSDDKLLKLGLSLIAGGGVGNAIDRLLRGYVIDYIKVSFFPPICNFADYCITAGVVVLVVYICFCKNAPLKNKSEGN